MSEKSQSDGPVETPVAPVELSSEQLDAVAGGNGVSLPAVQAIHPGGPGQQQGIIAILIGL